MRGRAWTLVPLLAVATLAGAGSVLAQAPRPMTLVDLAELPRVLDAQIAPDGRAVSYVLTGPDWNANRAVGHIWRQNLAGGPPVQLTRGETGETTARWSPDGRTLLFLARGAEGTTQLFVISADGGVPKPLTTHATAVAAPAWAPDGSVIYFTASDPKTADERERDRRRDDVYAFDEDFKQRHLWRVRVADGAEQRLTEGPFSVTGYRLSRDGRVIVQHRAPSPLAADSFRSEIWITSADGGDARALTSNRVEEAEAELSPDGTGVLFVAEASGLLEPYHSSALFVVPAGGGSPRRLPVTGAVEHASWAPDGASILAVVNQGVMSDVVRIHLASAARVEQLTSGEHSVQFWSLSAAARAMVFQLDEPARPGDVWTMRLDAAAPSRATGVYDTLARDFALPDQERVQWKGADGVSIEGVLIRPVGYQPGRRYPLIVQLHGGPAESDKFGWGPGVIVNYAPVLAARGYAVLRPNYRGSAGYGDDFLRDVVGHYFNQMHLDVMAGVDALVSRGTVDADQLGLMGWSAGGHLTNKLITFTDRFKAASSSAGAANWVSFFAQTDTRASRTTWFGGTPWDGTAPFDAFLAQSPIKDAARVRTPTLFIAGQEDARVPLAQSIEMHRALRANGVATTLYVAPREGHQWGELRHQLFKANVELEWFERHVRGRVYAPELAPAPGARP